MQLLETEHLFKQYGPIRAIEDVSFQVTSGEIYGLLGPNGAGKTTTLSMISGLLKPDSGVIRVNGVNVWSEPERAKRMMGVVPQEITLYEELTGRENMEFWGQAAGLSRTEARQRTKELLEALSLADRANDTIRKYSGGMKRRLNTGCALLHRPRLLLLDEPTVGIDPQARINLLEFIRARGAEGTGILYTTHYLEEAEQFCQRIGIIDHGRLLAEGNLEELRARLGGALIFVLEGRLDGANPASWPNFLSRYQVLQQSDHQLVISALGRQDPTECLKELLALPFKPENVTLKRPTLNDLFLQLTGRDLRE